jgi:hypothetical protein
MDDGMWNWAAGAIAVLFVIYITGKGELGAYISLLFYSPPGNAPKVATNPQQQADPSFNAIQGVDANGQPQLYPNSTAQGTPSQGGAGLKPNPPSTDTPSFLKNFTDGFGQSGIGAILRWFGNQITPPAR